MFTEGPKTFTAYIASGQLPIKRVVKIKSGTVTVPPQVELCSAGEVGIGITQNGALNGEKITVRMWQSPGTFDAECLVDSAIAAATVLYVGANGVVTDEAVGTTIGTALQTGADGQIIEFAPVGGLSTTAASVSIADALTIITGTTVETATQEIMRGIKTAQYCLYPQSVTLETGAPLLVFADGVSDGYDQLTDKEVVLRWNNGANPTKMAVRFVIPPDLNPAADMVVHFLGAIIKAGGSEADSPTITTEAYFAALGASMLADADCGGASGEFLTAATDTYQEKTLTIALANIPAVASVLTLIINPTDGQLPADDFALAGIWIEGTRSCLTS